MAFLLVFACGLAIPVHIFASHTHGHVHSADTHVHGDTEHAHHETAAPEAHDVDPDHETDASEAHHLSCFEQGHQESRHNHSNDGAHDHELLTLRVAANRLCAPTPNVAILPRLLELPEESNSAEFDEGLPSLLPSRGFPALEYRRGPPQA